MRFISIQPHERAIPASKRRIHKNTVVSIKSFFAHLCAVALTPIRFSRKAQILVPKTRHPLPPSRVSHSPCSLLLFINNLYTELAICSNMFESPSGIPNTPSTKAHIASKLATFVMRTVEVKAPTFNQPFNLEIYTRVY